MDPIIKIENVDLWYDKGKPLIEVHALKNINLSIERGDYVAFFGPSGCGKTTMLYAISGIDRFQSGKVLINDRDISGLTNQELAIFRQTGIGIVFQQFNLVPSLNVLKNVALPMLFVGISSEKAEAEAQKLLERLDLMKYADRYPYELSGGQQQRVGIARALANNPPIIIADEPLGNLDSVNAQLVLQFLKELNEKDGRTIIMVTHEAWSLRDVKTIFHMKDGQIISEEKTKNNKSADNKPPVITLVGANPMYINIGDKFVDPGATALDDVDGVCPVTVSGAVDTNTLGTYTLTYSTGDHSGNNTTATRTVEVILAPEYSIVSISGLHGTITPLGITSVKSRTDQTYNIIPDTGYSISTLTVDGVNLAVTPTYTFTNVTAPHTIEATFTMQQDLTPPVITLNGDNIISIIVGSDFKDPGATALDEIDGICPVFVTGTVNTSAVGQYIITYRATDLSGNTSFATRTVNVVLAPTYNIVVTMGKNGIIIPGGTTAVVSNTDQTYNIIPDTGYSISTLTVDGVNLAVTPTYTFTNVTAPHTIEATFVTSFIDGGLSNKERLSARILANFLLRGYSVEEIVRFESFVSDKFDEKISKGEFCESISKPFKDGGVGLRKNKVEKVVEFLEEIIEKRKEVEFINTLLKNNPEQPILSEIHNLRNWLLKDYKGEVSQLKIMAFDQIISDRIRGYISADKVVEILDLSSNKFGAGFSFRAAQLIAEKLELILDNNI